MTIQKIEEAAERALQVLASAGDVASCEVTATDTLALYDRIHYTSHLPSSGVEEPKSVQEAGLGLRVRFRDQGVGSAYSVGLPGGDGIARLLESARACRIEDPDFVSFPEPVEAAPAPASNGTPWIDALGAEEFVGLGWAALGGAVRAFDRAGRRADLIVGGDVTLVRERFAVRNSLGVRASEECSYALASVTAMVEGENTKGTGWSVASLPQDFDPEGAGAEAAGSALAAIGGTAVPDGVYRVVLGPQAMNELLGTFQQYVDLSVLDSLGSPFCGKLGEPVLHESLSVVDDPRCAKGIRRTVTSDGYPAEAVTLVNHGRFTAALADWYHARKSLRGERWRAVGADRPRVEAAARPRSGHRIFWDRPGRSYDKGRGIGSTNLTLSSSRTLPREELLRTVGEGLYIGRLWYTYSLNGLHRGDITGTVVGDSFLIEGGRLGRPLLPNRVRIHANLPALLQGVLGVGDRPRVTTAWSEFGRTIVTPECAVAGVRCTAIGEGACGG